MILPTISEDIAQDFPAAFDQVTELLKLAENNVVAIGSIDTFRKGGIWSFGGRLVPYR